MKHFDIIKPVPQWEIDKICPMCATNSMVKDEYWHCTNCFWRAP